MITEEQREMIDAQVRKRVKEEIGAGDHGKPLLVLGMVDARIGLGLGLDLENACPYIRDCKLKTYLCIHPDYRDFSCYRLRLASDLLDGKVNLEGISVA